jgi:hypothetical protein
MKLQNIDIVQRGILDQQKNCQLVKAVFLPRMSDRSYVLPLWGMDG